MTPIEIVRKLQENGHPAFFIGGYCRDLHLNKKQKSDIDIVTSARPDAILALFSDYNTKEVGKSFGVVLVDNIEVATYRRDHYSGLSDKNCKIEFANTLYEDSSRRDLTINTIAIDPISGKEIDYFNGISDIKEKKIKFVGNPSDRIFEDPNRILRACRFKALLHGIFDKVTFTALQEKSGYLQYVAQERIQKEVMKVMSTIKQASDFFITCHKIGALQYIFPALEKCIGVSQNKHHSETIFRHCMLAGDSVSCKFPLLKLTAYLHDIGKVEAKTFSMSKYDYEFLEHEDKGAKIVRKELENLKFSSKETDFIVDIVQNHMSFHLSSPKATRKTLRRIFKKFSICDMLRFMIADRKAKLVEGVNNPFTISQLKSMILSIENILVKNEPFALKNLAIDGFDIMQALKIQPGPLVGSLLNNLFEKVLETPEFNTKEQLLDLLKDEIPY